MCDLPERNDLRVPVAACSETGTVRAVDGRSQNRFRTKGGLAVRTRCVLALAAGLACIAFLAADAGTARARRRYRASESAAQMARMASSSPNPSGTAALGALA